MNINFNDRFDYSISMDSLELALSSFANEWEEALSRNYSFNQIMHWARYMKVRSVFCARIKKISFNRLNMCRFLYSPNACMVTLVDVIRTLVERTQDPTFKLHLKILYNQIDKNITVCYQIVEHWKAMDSIFNNLPANVQSLIDKEPTFWLDANTKAKEHVVYNTGLLEDPENLDSHAMQEAFTDESLNDIEFE